MSACANCGKDNPAEAQFCMSCGTALGRPEAREARKTVTVLFCDVTGSTALGERLDPETLNRLMCSYFEAMRAVIERHGGSVEKFIGDAVMALFGVPVLHEDDALRAVRAAEEMRQALEALNQDLERSHAVSIRTRTGVNTGPVLVTASTPGDLLAAEETARVALDSLPSDGEIRGHVDITTILALALCGQGRYDEAARYFEQSERFGVSEVFSTIARYGAGARISARLGEVDRGLSLAEQGVALGETTETLDTLGNALTAQAEVVRLARGPGDAVPILERALGLFERKGNLVSSARTRTWLAELSS